MACSENKWISTAWRRQNTKEKNSIVDEAMKTMDDVGVKIKFEEGNVRIDADLIDWAWKAKWKRLKEKLRKTVKKKRVEEYWAKEPQIKLYKDEKGSEEPKGRGVTERKSSKLNCIEGKSRSVTCHGISTLGKL